MKSRTINAIVCKKFDEWIKTITDESVRALVEKNTIMTGGSITSMLLNENVNDFDFYFRNLETAKAVAEYYVKAFKENPTPKFNGKDMEIFTKTENDRVKIIIKSAGIVASGQNEGYRYFEGDPNPDEQGAENYVKAAVEAAAAESEDTKPKYRPVFLSANAITLSNGVQLVIRFFGDPAQIHENYDFVHCTNYWNSWERKVFLNQAALECILAKELRYVGSKYPICSVFRIRKFIQRGWTITAGQLLKILFQVTALKLDDMNVLEEQLTGVDTAYFIDIIKKLKEKDPLKVDTSYLIAILERLF